MKKNNRTLYVVRFMVNGSEIPPREIMVGVAAVKSYLREYNGISKMLTAEAQPFAKVPGLEQALTGKWKGGAR